MDEKIYGLSKVEECSSKVERVQEHPQSRQRKRKYSEVWRIDLETRTDHYLKGILKEEQGEDTQAVFKEIAFWDIFRLEDFKSKLHLSTKHGNKNKFIPKHMVAKFQNIKEKTVWS